MQMPVHLSKWLIVGFMFALAGIVSLAIGPAKLATANAASTAPVQLAGGSPAADPHAATSASQSTAAPGPASAVAANGASPALVLDGAASTVNSTMRITATPDGFRGEAATPNSRVRINTVIGGPNTADMAGSPTGVLAQTSPSGTPTVVPLPTGAPTSSASPVSLPTAAQRSMPVAPHSSVTPIGAWGPPQPLPPQAFVSPPFFAQNLWNPLPGATSRGVGFSEWESYRTDVAGRNILVTTDDSNFFRDRNGKINANTGDVDASGLNVVGANDSVIRGSESADEAPYQTMAAGLVDLASIFNGEAPNPDPDPAPDPVAAPDPDPEGTQATQETQSSQETQASQETQQTGPTQATPGTGPTSPAPSPGAATAAVVAPASTCDTCSEEFPFQSWIEHATSDHATAVHTDEGTTLASGSDAIVIGGDGYDDDDNRAVGENIAITRDDGNVVIGGTGDVNAQIGDSEQGAVVMDVNRTFIQGGGAY